MPRISTVNLKFSQYLNYLWKKSSGFPVDWIELLLALHIIPLFVAFVFITHFLCESFTLRKILKNALLGEVLWHFLQFLIFFRTIGVDFVVCQKSKILVLAINPSLLQMSHLEGQKSLFYSILFKFFSLLVQLYQTLLLLSVLNRRYTIKLRVFPVLWICDKIIVNVLYK